MDNEYFCTPLPKQQILYHLDLLKNHNPQTIILTDSIEAADINQRFSSSTLVGTSWLWQNYDYVDWSPLKESESEIYYLITNHSDQNLADAYVKANEVASYLNEKHDIDLKFIQLEVDF